MDFITDLPESDGFDSIFVVVDHGLTKGVIFTPCNKTIDALGTADLYFNNVYKRFGLPSVMISDRGPQFAAKTFQELTKALGVDHRMSTAYHPQTDGQTERVNQELENHLRILCRNDPTEWAKALPTAEFAHNQRTHEARNMSPFKLMYGTEPVAIPMAIPRTTVPAVEERLRELKQLREEALAAHELSKQRMAQRITPKGKPYKVGDKVWLSTQNLTIPGRPRKLAPRRTGPLIVLKVVGPVTYKLKLPRQWKIHDTFHASYLSPYKETDFHGPNHPEPPPDILNGEEHYEVEAILDHKGVGRRRLYYLKWKGYSDKDNSWEPETGLDNAKALLRRYKKRYKL
jgi:transposase InsO family protein